MRFLASRYFTRTEPNSPPNQGVQKRGEAFARDVLRNQEEHRPVGMLWPFPTLLHLVEEHHMFPSLFLTIPKGPPVENRHSPPSWKHCSSFLLFRGSLLLPVATLPPNFSAPCSFTACFSCLAPRNRIADLSPTLSSFLMSGQTVWRRHFAPRREFPMRRVVPRHGVVTARMTPTAQAGWKSWYVPAPIVTFNSRRVATQPSPDHVNDLRKITCSTRGTPSVEVAVAHPATSMRGIRSRRKVLPPRQGL